ncbi:PIGBOS1 isoform 3 [Pan troglodytes]|uniref:PIGBOS1 isoform 1 n=3 Tax=Pan TaxID=9596 RepID=A0A6D2X412_PANTR|nr:protein PIGBOS1 [Pan troglodytes]XP_016783753.1 protein PIGBOS1 [Pan troglodytes]XP_016783754.1 protein PIGBOS1 [Pan troglodytes]XP_018866361.1 protein PIGBOS1 [Gorilla gorilla gorilla]XP_024781509.1 protein PIGBOS1 [Pan paniscus]XP_024781511.1 protein PIGBOS1 [Pan paniscus]XP_034794692.1 protein PIGBOS1 [Pan paniscus]XP_054523529.1 protein PIGBOS1 [Pan troglodytes]PNI74749.1 PIGBOS1 isoform 1 [Pan troglodytes]PNI74750.1 PIGBOS1 isoform 3 [Pan troglodytes]
MFRRLTFAQLLFATVLGIAGGVYIFQPVFEQYAKDQKELKEKVQLVQESEEKKS